MTQYLSIVAGFVEFPIVITEGDRKTIVLHPYQDAEAARSRFGADFEVHQIDLSHPWEEVFFPQDLHTAREVFEEHTLDMRDDLGLEGYEGKLLHFLPRPEVDLRRYDSDGATAYRIESPDAQEMQIRYHRPRTLDSRIERLARSAGSSFVSLVYRDGILLPDASIPDWLTRHYRRVPPRMVVNLPKSQTPRVDLARTMIRAVDLSWDAPIWNKILERHFDAQIERLCLLDPSERLLATARVLAYGLIEVEELCKRFPTERWPMAEISPDGVFRPTELGALGDHPLYPIPPLLAGFVQSVLSRYPQSTEVDRSIMARWKGGSLLLLREHFETSLLASSICELTRMAMYRAYVHCGTRFLAGPSKDGPPIAQTIYVPAPSGVAELEVDALVANGAGDPTQLKLPDLQFLVHELVGWNFEITAFESPYKHRYAYGSEWVNSRHPTVQLLVRIACALRLAQASGKISRADEGRMGDRLKATFPMAGEPVERLRKRLREALDHAHSLGLVDIDIVSLPLPQPDDFVTGTIVERDGEPTILEVDEVDDALEQRKEDSSEFGRPLS